MADSAWWTPALSLSLSARDETCELFGGLLLYSTDTPDLSCEPFLLLLFPMGLIIQRKESLTRSSLSWFMNGLPLDVAAPGPPRLCIWRWFKHWNSRIARWAWLSRNERKMKNKRAEEMPSIDARRMFDALRWRLKGGNLGGVPTCVQEMETSLHSSWERATDKRLERERVTWFGRRRFPVMRAPANGCGKKTGQPRIGRGQASSDAVGSRASWIFPGGFLFFSFFFFYTRHARPAAKAQDSSHSVSESNCI